MTKGRSQRTAHLIEIPRLLSDFLLIGAKTDAFILAEMTQVPAFTWAILWSGLSLLVVYAAGKQALYRR